MIYYNYRPYPTVTHDEVVATLALDSIDPFMKPFQER